MKASRFACVLIVTSFAAVGCASETEEVPEEPGTGSAPSVSVDVKEDAIAPNYLSSGCMLATAGMTMNLRRCTHSATGSNCSTIEATCGLHWVGLTDGFWQFYWTYRVISTEWIPYENELQ